MLCHPELHPAVTYALRNVKSRITTATEWSRAGGHVTLTAPGGEIRDGPRLGGVCAGRR